MVVAGTAIRFRLPLDLPSNLIMGIVVLPMAAKYLFQYRWAPSFAVLSVVAAVAGALLTFASMGEVSTPLLVAQSGRILGLGVLLAVFLWAKALAGTRRTVFAFALGSIVNVAFVGANDANLWKFTLAAPLTLLLLSLPRVYGRRFPQALVLAALAGASLAFDSRSLAGFLVVALALTLTLPSSRSELPRSRGSWLTAVRIALVVLGAYLLLQAAILEGMLGDEIRDRTQAQIQTGGSVLTGGRPEVGASVALLTANPWGFGAGVLASPQDILVAKTGMAALGYDPNNGYVENYMFGLGFEVHSVLGNLWILAGPIGALLALFAAVWLIRGIADEVSSGVASAVAIYLATRSLWDIGFSPLFTSATLLPLALAVIATTRVSKRRQPDPLYYP
ncbi:hypothetical protein QL996_14980 [Planococcus sp. APC 4015]|nr:hypothetical protein [Planococcus sp. APC 4015]